jgi:NADH-quinone oxidoreductase subunit J
MPDSSRIFYPLLAAFALFCLVTGFTTAQGEGLVFGLFAFLTIGGSLVCIWERSVVRSAFSLMGTFLGVAGLFLLLGASFLAMAQILIYVGGILALLLFGVMLSPPDMTERKLPRVIGAFALIGGAVAWVAFRVGNAVESWGTLAHDVLPEPESHAKEIGMGFLRHDQYVIAFELAAFFLTVALVAAVYIARRARADFEPEGTV